MTSGKSIAVWQNILLAIPIGAVGGALAAVASFAPYGVNGNFMQWLLWAWSIAQFGGVIGLATFPLAYATVGRTNNVFAVVPAGLVATVLGVWISFGFLAALPNLWPAIAVQLGVSQFLIALLLPILAMFGACAWAGARERLRIAGRP